MGENQNDGWNNLNASVRIFFKFYMLTKLFWFRVFSLLDHLIFHGVFQVEISTKFRDSYMKKTVWTIEFTNENRLINDGVTENQRQHFTKKNVLQSFTIKVLFLWKPYITWHFGEWNWHTTNVLLRWCIIIPNPSICTGNFAPTHWIKGAIISPNSWIDQPKQIYQEQELLHLKFIYFSSIFSFNY